MLEIHVRSHKPRSSNTKQLLFANMSIIDTNSPRTSPVVLEEEKVPQAELPMAEVNQHLEIGSEVEPQNEEEEPPNTEPPVVS